jgi:predicted Rossmann fold flavoprotein
MIKLSAWAAREFYDSGYQLPLTVCWLPKLSLDEIKDELEYLRTTSKKMCVSQSPFESIPIRLWVYFVQKILGTTEKRWQELGKKDILRFSECLRGDRYQTAGKGVFKEEFVTCGGVKLSEVNFKTMESKICPGLFFVGEVLDIDGVTGGFNFQNAWTTGFLAGKAYL